MKRNTDRHTQHYWDRSHRIVLFGSGKGKCPVIKLTKDARGFGDADHPKFAVSSLGGAGRSGQRPGTDTSFSIVTVDHP